MFDLYVKKDYVSAVLVTKENAVDIAMLVGGTVAFTKDGQVAQFNNARGDVVPLTGDVYVDPDGWRIDLRAYALAEDEED